MSNPRFLVDEHVPAKLVKNLRTREPGMELLCVGESGAPARGTLDPDLLLAAEAQGRVLLTMDRKSMPQHLTDHFAAGHHTAGVILIRQGFALPVIRDGILLIWGATTADEWVDQTKYIP
jgi:hypothetical protein